MAGPHRPRQEGVRTLSSFLLPAPLTDRLMAVDNSPPPLSLSAALTRLVLVALLGLQVVYWFRMSRRDEWLTWAVVIPAPIVLNDRLEPARLYHEVRWMKRALRPIVRKEDVTGRFLTASAIDRCRQSNCTDLALVETDVALRPEFAPDTEVFKAVLGEPWRVGDIRVGDQVYAVPGGGPVAAGRGGAATPGGTVIPTVEGRQGLDPAPGAATPPSDPEAVDATEMIVVGLAGEGASSSAFLVPIGSIDPPRLQQFRTRGVRVTSIRATRERPK